MNSDNNKKRIAKNTMMLYFRMLLNLGITLYTSRLILEYLGVVDYGLYNVVGGLVSVFSLISGSLSNAVSRFLAFELGKNNTVKLKKIFSISVTIHIILAVIIFIGVETIGSWFLNNHLNVPKNRVVAANWVLLFSTLTFMLNLIRIPYDALVIAHEKMKIYSYISILEVLLKLLIVFLLALTFIDQLILYSILLFITALILFSIYLIYSKKSFEESAYSIIWDKDIFNEISQFASWNFLGVLANIFKTQGVTLLLNIFWGTTVNAAQGISNQVNNAVQRFADNFIMAVNPQIIKSFAQQKHDEVIQLVETSSRLSFYLILLLSFPIFCNTNFILELWLKKVPNYTDVFVQLILINTLIEVFSKPIITLINATGKIRGYQIGISIALFFNFPLSYIALSLNYQPKIVYLISICLSIIALIFRLIIIKYLTSYNIIGFIKSIFYKSLIITLLAILMIYIVSEHFTSGWVRLFTVTFLAEIILLLTIVFIGLNKKERILISNLIKKKH